MCLSHIPTFTYCVKWSNVSSWHNNLTMASAPEENQNRFSFEDVKSFPSVMDGKINIVCFLEATSDLITLVGRLGKAFAPVKYDMQGNIDKIKMHYKYDLDSCLLELMLDEHSKGQHTAIEGVLWLNRALLFFELAFREIIVCLQSKNYDENMKKIFTVAYEGSVKKYHNWITQQLFALICKMSPTLPQIMKSFEIENNDTFETRLLSFNATLNSVRSKIDDFFMEHNMLQDLM